MGEGGDHEGVVVGAGCLDGHFLEEGVTHVGEFEEGDIGGDSEAFFKEGDEEEGENGGEGGGDEGAEKLTGEDGEGGLVEDGDDTGEEDVDGGDTASGFV